MRSWPAANCPPLPRPHNLHYVQVPAAACDALRTRQGAADAALVDPLPAGDDEEFGCRTFDQNRAT
jgi:hypothetical protein